MKTEFSQKERQKIRHFYFICNLKYLLFTKQEKCITISFAIIYILECLFCLIKKQDTMQQFIIIFLIYFTMNILTILAAKLLKYTCMKSYGTLEIFKPSHKIGGMFVEKKASDIISSYKNDFKKIQNDYKGSYLIVTTHTLVILQFLRELIPPSEYRKKVREEISAATESTDKPFSKSYNFPGLFNVTITRSKKGKDKNGVKHNSLRFIKYIHIPFDEMTDEQLEDLYTEDVFYDLRIEFPH